MFLEFVVLACLGILAVASWIDLKTGEVPESCSMGFAALVGLASLWSAAYYSDFGYLWLPAFWGFLAFSVAYVIFYFGQWGGGDVKLLGGIGGLLGLLEASGYIWPNNTFIGLAIPSALCTYGLNMALLAGPYVIAYTIFIGLRQPMVFKVFLERFREPQTLLTFAVSILPLFFAVYFEVYALAYVYALVPFMVAASVYMKTVEETLMSKTVRVSDLREWDIIAEDVIVDGLEVAPKGNIEGITPEQLAKLKAYSAEGRFKDTVKTKWGVKFVPVLFLSLPATVYAGNLLETIFTLIFQTR
jgi:hypothetical protein